MPNDTIIETLLTIVENTRKTYGNRSYKSYICKCQCGNITTVIKSRYEKKKIRSCGCLQRKNASIANTKHGNYKHPEYELWRSILKRCYNIKNKQFKLPRIKP